jgi:type II secretory pathway pseudopilin PulG
MKHPPDLYRAYTLLEVVAVAAILVVIALVGCPRATQGAAESKTAACSANRGHIEVQCEIWRHNNGSWPAANLSDIGTSISYFPSGLPTCPVTGAAYTIDTSGRVVGHNH